MALVVIVDDSRLARAFATVALQEAGHAVAEVEPTSLEAVMEELRHLRPDLLLLDQHMPACPGSSLVRACFEDPGLSGLRVVMLTAQRDEDLEHRMEKLGVHGILHKPISPQDLVATVEEVLSREG